jgi:tripartite-type tricarboxylate transporter receptor subunit TctC
MAITSRRIVLSGLAALGVSGHSRSLSAAGVYPERPIRLIVPYAPGGSADFTARLISQHMGERLGQSFAVDNKPGANGILAAEAVSKAAPDGYTLLLAPRELGINPSISKALPYDTRTAFEWIGIATEGPFVMVVNPSVEVKSIAELVSVAKANPGKLTYASIGIGSIAHLNVEALKHQLGIDLLHVPYKGAGPAVAATLSGEVSMTVSAIPAALGLINDGRLRAIAVGSATRLTQLPHVPTLQEAGTATDTFVPTFFGFAAPKATPRPIIDALNAAMKDAVASSEVVQTLNENGLTPVGGSPEAMAQTIEADIKRFGALVQTIGIKIE